MNKIWALLCIVMGVFTITQVFADGSSSLSSSSNENCTVKRALCVPKTARCHGDFIYDNETCRHSNFTFTCCEYPLYCINGTCKEDNIGDNCTEDSDCVISFYGTGIHKCIDGTCQMLLNANDYCNNDTDCADNMTCEEGRCKGHPLYSKCTPPVRVAVRPALFGLSHYVCDEGLVCAPEDDKENSYYRCIYGGNLSDTCNKTNPCNPYFVCNKGKCVKPYSLDIGEECDNDQACKCLDGVCIESVDYEYVECTSDTDCKEGTNGICGECNHITGKRTCGIPDIVDYCSQEWRSAYGCYERKKCAPVPGSVMDTCVQEQCTTETNNLLSCKMNCALFRGELSICAANLIVRNCPIFPMWARIVTAFTILFAAVLTIFIVYGVSIVMTKKKYSHLNSS